MISVREADGLEFMINPRFVVVVGQSAAVKGEPSRWFVQTTIDRYYVDEAQARAVAKAAEQYALLDALTQEVRKEIDDRIVDACNAIVRLEGRLAIARIG